AYRIAGCESAEAQLPSYYNGGSQPVCKCSSISVYRCSTVEATKLYKDKGMDARPKQPYGLYSG
ncbi:hypothetical protein BDQ12DRAFT_608221, partial [Crucibulum laeve]